MTFNAVGKDVAVLGADGKAIDSKDLLKRLAKPTAVAVFMFPAGVESKPGPFYLGAGVGGNGTPGKYVKNKVVSVEDPALQHLFNVPDLAGREFVIENGHISRIFRHPGTDLFQLTAADVGP